MAQPTVKDGLWRIESLAGQEQEWMDAAELQQVISEANYLEVKAGGNHIVYRYSSQPARIARRTDL